VEQSPTIHKLKQIGQNCLFDLAFQIAENLARSVDNCNAPRASRRLHLFEPCRIDSKVPVEDQIRTLAALQKGGKFDHIGLFEVGEASLRRAAAIAPISLIEIEVSPISYEEETKKGDFNFFTCLRRRD